MKDCLLEPAAKLLREISTLPDQKITIETLISRGGKTKNLADILVKEQLLMADDPAVKVLNGTDPVFYCESYRLTSEGAFFLEHFSKVRRKARWSWLTNIIERLIGFLGGVG